MCFVRTENYTNYYQFVMHFFLIIFIPLIYGHYKHYVNTNNNAVKMCSDSQSLSSIPSNLLVYVLICRYLITKGFNLA